MAAQQVFDAFTHGEGWIHDVDQAIVDEGDREEDPSQRVASLFAALLRHARDEAAIRLHRDGLMDCRCNPEEMTL